MRHRITTLAVLIAGLIGAVGVWWLQQQPPADRSIRLELPIEQSSESILATYPNTFRCTLYYSPRESGFTREGGFDLAPETRPGLNDRKFARDFLRAVQVEGFGRLKEPVDGKWYVRYWSKEWGYIEEPVDQHQHPLVARQSCAISQPHELVQPDAWLRIRCPSLPPDFDILRWRVSDTGSRLEPRQLDLYWGEDDPLGPGKKVSCPKGGNFDLPNPTILVIAGNGARK
jgi:hypothetical protein